MGKAIAFTLIMAVSCLILLFFLLGTNVTNELVSRKIDSQSLQVKKYNRADETIKKVHQQLAQEQRQDTQQALATQNNNQMIEDDSRPLINN